MTELSPTARRGGGLASQGAGNPTAFGLPSHSMDYPPKKMAVTTSDYG